MAESWDIGLAKRFKERENKPQIGNIVGKVISPSPDIKISILDGNVVLYKEQLYCCEHVLAGYKRKIKITEFNTMAATSTHKLTSGGSLADYTYTSIDIPEANAEAEHTDSLVEGDLVLVVPTADEQTWFIVDKIKKL